MRQEKQDETQIEVVLAAIVNCAALQGVRPLVAGWNGEALPEPYKHRHPAKLGARIETNCGSIYELDELLVQARLMLAA